MNQPTPTPTPKDPLEVPLGPITRLRAKKFKEAINGLLQSTWTKVDFKHATSQEDQALINLLCVQDGLGMEGLT